MGKIIPRPESNLALAVPDHLKTLGQEGVELLKQYVVLPRIKFVQPLSKAPFKPPFSDGDAVAVPTMHLVAKYDTEEKAAAFHCVPILFYPEWCCWNPLETKGMLPAVRERSFDRKSIVAIKANDPDKRNSEVCPQMPEKDRKPLFLKYLEHLNFLVMMLEPSPLAGSPIVLTFSSGEHRAGSSFASLIQMRKAPIYGCVFEGIIRQRENQKGRWFGVDMCNPSAESGVQPWLDVEATDRMRVIHQDLKKKYEDQVLQVQYEDPEEEVETPKNNTEY